MRCQVSGVRCEVAPVYTFRDHSGLLETNERADLARNNRKITLESLNKNGNVQDLINFVNEKKPPNGNLLLINST